LIEEARRRARRRRQRTLVGGLAALLGALGLYSVLGGTLTGSAHLTQPSFPAVGPPRAALPEEITFNADGAVWVIRRDGTHHRLIDRTSATTSDGSLRTIVTFFGVDWSPDGSKLLTFRQGSSPALVLVDRDGHVGPTVAVGASIGRWSPDGSRIAFMRDTPGAGNAIWVVESDGTNPTLVAPFGTREPGSFSWSPDGRQIVYAGSDDAELLIADASGLDTPEAIRFRQSEDFQPGTAFAQPQWSPDGSLIAFRTGGNVYASRPDGTGARRLGAGNGYGLAWSPDSRWMAFAGPAGPRTFGNLTVVGRDGSRLHRMARCSCTLRGPGFAWSFAWSSDSTRLAYVGGRGNEIMTMRLDGTGATSVLTGPSQGPTRNWYPWSPIWRPDRG
jgi:Tol biopolymer transport system component